MNYADVDRIYRTLPLDQIPWNSGSPPEELTGLVKDGTVRPCRAVDLGCGAGNYAIYFPASALRSRASTVRPPRSGSHGSTRKRSPGAGLWSLISSATCMK